MIFLVNDANILIDLLKINLLDTFFKLEFDFQVTDMVFAEIREENLADLKRCIDLNLLTMQGFTFEDLLQIQLIEDNNPVLSVADCSCLCLAEKFSGTLLTGDGALRRIAEQQNIPVHGILWVLDELIARGLLAKTEAHDKLLQLKELNPRLPDHECRKRLKAWKARP
jgi:predicted nucleic acid-binding protein